MVTSFSRMGMNLLLHSAGASTATYACLICPGVSLDDVSLCPEVIQVCGNEDNDIYFEFIGFVESGRRKSKA